ncbi:hypothetical protein TNCV_4221141 [Trichonephila clavipes]|nr:hypothetical protein TNCV_4221141 [Trichonephila clavipes]
MYMPFFDVPTRQESKVWVFQDDPMPTIVKRQRAMKKSNVCRFLQKYGTGPSHQDGRTEDSNSKLGYLKAFRVIFVYIRAGQLTPFLSDTLCMSMAFEGRIVALASKYGIFEFSTLLLYGEGGCDENYD